MNRDGSRPGEELKRSRLKGVLSVIKRVLTVDAELEGGEVEVRGTWTGRKAEESAHDAPVRVKEGQGGWWRRSWTARGGHLKERGWTWGGDTPGYEPGGRVNGGWLAQADGEEDPTMTILGGGGRMNFDVLMVGGEAIQSWWSRCS